MPFVGAVVVVVAGIGGGGGGCDSIGGGCDCGDGAALWALEASWSGEVTPLAESLERYFSKTAGRVRVWTKRMSRARAWRRWVRTGGLKEVSSPWRRAKGRAADAIVGWWVRCGGVGGVEMRELYCTYPDQHHGSSLVLSPSRFVGIVRATS